MKIKELLALGAALAAGFGVVASTTADAGSNLCDPNRVCIYTDHSFSGLLGTRGPGGGLRNVSDHSNDKMSSWENKTRQSAAWYHSANGTGTCRNMRPGTELRWVEDEHNDRLTSWRTNRGC
ncbi:peptidase inhibitor family I36 protein [Tessaracoccus sp. OH4464_COT-324]|uniref:peptidase inhibitor family I36 protein n=1 Tax=Tessaracoccus sp. OH4464_COT-324 TaxID=2491059 RepID=UPI000F62DEB9|nr:peptidase inhibitor family I36 protein [Tessaracoccus sp. OH4464_COT-324]RRD45798.1 hypothetical protein EII42_10040 [Tessaracoccus sp. OH4464_COT-324]